MKEKMLKWLEENNLEIHGLDNLEKFINGNFRRLKNGNIKYPIELPKSIMKEGKEGIPLSTDDYKIIPLILFVKEKDLSAATE